MRLPYAGRRISSDCTRLANEEEVPLAASTAVATDDNPRPTRLEYNAGLDGLRGVGVTVILFYHSGVNWIPGGVLSVSTFFTLSGFLITSLLLYEWDNTGRIDIGRFWSHRFRRLMPGALMALAAISVIGGTIGDSSQVKQLFGDGLAALFYVSNWRFIYLGNDYADMFASPSLVQHFWSLSIEEQFYLSFPFIAMALLRFGNRRVFAIAIAGLALLSTAWMAMLFEPDAPTSRMYYGTDTRVSEIMVGALLALWHAGRPALKKRASQLAIWLGCVALAVNLYYWGAVPMESPWLWQGGFLLYSIITSLIILATLQPSGPVRTLLSWGPLPWLGRISYGVYIYHFSFYVTLTEELTGLEPWPLFVARIAATFALAVPSYYLIEQPVRRGRVMAGRQIWVAMPVGMALVVATLYLATLNPPKQAVDLSDMTDKQRVFESSSGPRIMIIGGSISYGVGKGLLRWAADSGEASVFNFARKGCGISRGGRLVNKLKRDADRCDTWPRRFDRQLAKHDPDSVVVLVGGWDTTERAFPEWGDEPLSIGDERYDEWLLSEYEEAVETLRSQGARVYWLTSPCLKVRHSGLGVWNPERTAKLNHVFRRLEQRLGDKIELIDFFDKVCPNGEFSNQLGGLENARPDGAHLSDEAADWIATWLTDTIAAKSNAEK